MARALIAALLIGLMTVTPLSAALEQGRHETRFPAQGTLVPALPVTLDDRTGLVASVRVAAPAVDEGVSNPDGNDRLIRIGWLGGACDHHAWLLFERSDAGFRLRLRTDRADGCILMGVGRAIEVLLRTRIDGSAVELDEVAD